MGAHAQNAANPIIGFVPMLFVLAVIYFLIIRPQQRAASTLREQVNALKVGDRILTQGGIYGTVTGIKGDTVQVKIADNVKVDIAKNAITQVLKEGQPS